MQVKIINKIPVSAVRKKRVCAYARVSTDSRRQEDSLENQTDSEYPHKILYFYLREYADGYAAVSDYGNGAYSELY